jgi:hypothetical protein
VKRIFITAMLAACFVPRNFPGTLSVITMNNGAVYKCEIKDYSGGYYTIDIKGGHTG